MKARKKISPKSGFFGLEHRAQKVISHHRFAQRMALAGAIWLFLTLFGLAIGMAGYAWFESMNFADAFVNAAMILSGMGPVETDLKSAASKIFAGTYAIFSGLLIVVATGFVLAPVFHRVLHRFHVERKGEE